MHKLEKTSFELTRWSSFSAVAEHALVTTICSF